MQQFTVPQFIDVEDKIIGPITTRQFIIMLAAFLLMAISYKVFDFSLFVVISLFLFATFGTMAFARINGRPFHFFVLNFVQTIKRDKLRIWGKFFLEDKGDYEKQEIDIGENIPLPKSFSSSRLAELSLVVDTQGEYRGEENVNKSKIEIVE